MAHFGQRALPGPTRVGGTTRGADPLTPDSGATSGRVAAVTGGAGAGRAAADDSGSASATVARGPSGASAWNWMRDADAEIGLPQSMQKRELGSFARPQKVQAVFELTAGRGRPWGANIRKGSRGANLERRG